VDEEAVAIDEVATPHSSWSTSAAVGEDGKPRKIHYHQQDESDDSDDNE
jgi:hypothetical protein